MELKLKEITQKEYDDWYAITDSNLERFKFASSIKSKIEDERAVDPME